MNSMRLSALPIFTVILLAFLRLSHGQGLAFAPSPATPPPPSSDGTAIDQGIAYFLLLVALAITYLFH